VKLVVGLGNPGEKYKNNRHNAGFVVVDELAKKWDLPWKFSKKLTAEVVTVVKDKLVLLKPQTFMNSSGEAVSKALNFFNINPTDLTVVHDDVDLEALQFKVSHGSSSAGHHGVQDIIDRLGTQEFTRLRVGVGRPAISGEDAGRLLYDVEKYVLQNFPPDQLEIVKRQGIEHLLSSLNL
jgi:peptidyl-tRNA hydrolase, PTH1 family